MKRKGSHIFFFFLQGAILFQNHFGFSRGKEVKQNPNKNLLVLYFRFLKNNILSILAMTKEKSYL